MRLQHSLLALLAGLGCASAPSAPAVSLDGTAARGYVRSLTGIEVLDPQGRAYSHPFIGGFDVPRPQFVDIDGDGDLDLFVQERSNELMFFENAGSAQAPRFEWRTDKYQGMDVGEWTRFADVDRDGDLDVLAEQPFSYVRYYRNEGSASAARFVLAEDSVKDATGQPLFSDRQNIPQAVDLDCDNLLDFFLGRVDGTVTRYEQVADGPDGNPRFAFVTDRFEGIEIVGQLVGSMRHGANSMFFADIDKDGDLDFFWGDFFEPGVLQLANSGSCSRPLLRGEPRGVVADGDTIATSGYNAPYLADIDADGDLDLFIGVLGGAFNPNTTSSNNFHFYRRGADGSLSLETPRFIDGIDVGGESNPAFADIDGDGDQDLIVGNKIDPATLTSARLYVFSNIGNARTPRFQLTDTLSLVSQYHQAPELADLDGDGDQDMLLGTWNDGVLYFRNEGSRTAPRWVQDTARTIAITRGSQTAPALVDTDGDGDLDLFIGEASGALNYYRNTGTAQDARFELVSDEFLAIDAGRRSHPAFVDTDGDGDLDMVIGREEGGVVHYRNDGGERFVLDASFAVPLLGTGSPAFVDIDGDGDHDLFAGAISGGVTFFERR